MTNETYALFNPKLQETQVKAKGDSKISLGLSDSGSVVVYNMVLNGKDAVGAAEKIQTKVDHQPVKLVQPLGKMSGEDALKNFGSVNHKDITARANGWDRESLRTVIALSEQTMLQKKQNQLRHN